MLKQFILGLTFLLTACASKPTLPSQNSTVESKAKPVSKQTVATIQQSSKPISSDTLTNLLLAEIAGQRQHYRYALNVYLKQAQQTKDAEVAKRSLDIAKFVQDLPAQQQALAIWLKASPKNTQALAQAAKFYLRSGNTLKAFGYMQQLEALKSYTPYHYLALFGEHLSVPQKKQLLNRIRQQHSNNADNQANLLYAQGLLQQQLKLPKAAMQSYKSALKMTPKRKDIGLQKARLLLLQNKPQQALDWVNQLSAHYPDDKSIALLQARLLIHTQRQQAALDAFAVLHQAHPFDGDILLSLALLELDMLQDNAAKAHLTKLLNQQQNLNQAHYYLGRLARKYQQYDKALTHFYLITKSREYLPAKTQIIDILYHQKGAAFALKYVRQLQQDSARPNLNFLLLETDILMQDKQFKAAMSTYNKGIKQFPNSPDLLYARAVLSIEQDNLSLAEQDLKRMLVLNKDDDKALNTLGYTLLIKTQRIDEAKILITRAYELNPKSAAILDSLGWLYFKLGDLEEAKSFLEEAFAKNQDSEIAAHLGEVLWLRGNRDAAQEVWTKALKADPNSAIIQQTKERLNAN